MDVEPVTALTPRPIRRTWTAQDWLDATFVHWEVPVHDVARLLPTGLAPDVFEGRTYVGLVAFRMARVGVTGKRGVPYFGHFAETNVRVYTRDARGRRGVFFLSLDAARLAPVLLARAVVHVPYVWSWMRLEERAGTVRYRSRRRLFGTRPARLDLQVRPGEAVAEPSALEVFLTARWGAHVDWYGRTRYLPNEHPAWALYRSETLHLEQNLIQAAGLQVQGEPVSVLWSPGVSARFGTT